MKRINNIFCFLVFISAFLALTAHAQKNPSPNACNCNLFVNVTQTVTCNGYSDGAANANGNSIGIDCDPETFSDYYWEPGGETTQSISGKPAGTYTVTWSNDNCGGVTKTVTITQPSAITATPGSQNETCNQNNGSVWVSNVSGGAGGYTYQWNTGHTTTAVGNRNSGTYTCTITDANGCTKAFTATVSNSLNPPTANVQSSTNVKCKGGNDGSATASNATGGGGGPYTYTWNPGNLNGQTVTGLSSGTYTLTVTGSNTCTATDVVTITQPSASVTATTNSTPASCGGANGGASITVSGGNTPYTYSWSPAVAGNVSAATGLSAGNYDITVTDGNGCVKTFSVNVSSTNGFSSITGSSLAVSCKGGSDGSAAVSVSGGTPNYTYSWNTSPAQNTQTAIGLSAGTYNVIVTDANGCTISTGVTVTEPAAALSTGTSTTPANCGTATGSVAANPSGGTPNYTYSWNTSPVQNTQTAVNLFSGTYMVTVTDANGCTKQASAVVSSTGGITAAASVTQNVTCNGGSNGAATVTPSSGQSPFTYQWSPSGGNSSAATGLASGNYTVTVTDANGCTDTDIIFISQPSAISASPSSNPANCLNAGGSASANASGGTGGLNYSWAPSGGNSATATGLSQGSYTVSITDQNSCVKTATVAVGMASPPSLTATSSNVTCNGDNNGSAIANPSGGAGPYTYAWNPSSQNTQTATGLSPGTYSVTVTDANFCTAVATAAITQPAVLTASTSVINASCGSSNGSATATPSGGTSPYTYAWSPSGGTNATANNLTASQTYTVNITDAKGCLTSATLNISGTPAATLSISTTTSVTCNGGNDGTATVNPGGTSPYTFAWSPSGGTNSSASNLTAGNYTVTVTDANSCTANSIITIAQPAAITAVTNFTQATCQQNDGSASVTASGGTGNISYSWSTGATTTSISNLFAGTYTLTITDANNCTKVTSVTVTNANAPTVNVISNNPVTCFGDADGSASVSVSGTNPPFTYSWSPSGGTTSAASGLTAGNYQVIVTDTLGCLASQTLTVGEPSQLLPNLTNTSFSICIGSSTTLESNPSGGTPGYLYNWSPGITLDDSTSSKPNASPTVTTLYVVAVTDSKGCTGVDSVTVTVNNLPNITAGADLAVCVTNPQTTLTAGGGASYIWQPGGQSTSSITVSPSSTSTYIVTGTDVNACSNTDTIIVSVVQTPTVNISPSATNICSGDSVTLIASSNVSVYQWSSGQTTASITVAPSVPSTAYTLTVFAGTCQADTSITISAVQTPTASISGNTILCIGNSQTLTASSGSYNYSWSTTATTSSINISPTANTTYTVIISATANVSCADTATLAVTVASLPAITSSATFDTICIGSATDTLTASGGATYVWSTTETTSSIVTMYSAIGTYTYSVVGTDTNGCSNTSSLSINVTNGFPPPSVSALGSVTICYMDSLFPFTGSPSPSTNQIEWIFGTQTAMGDTLYPLQGLPAGTYTVNCYQSSGGNCKSLATSSIVTILPLPNVNAGGDVTLCPGYSTPLTASGGGTYLWTPPTDLTGTTISNPTAEPQLTTTYEVMVTDVNNCKNKDSITVYIVLNDTCEVVIYNLISPNTDGKNDEWWIDGIKFFPDNNVQIFNRWGAKVWEGSGYDNEEVVWRGDNQDGKKLPAATYYYILNFGDGSKTKTGIIELVR